MSISSVNSQYSLQYLQDYLSQTGSTTTNSGSSGSSSLISSSGAQAQKAYGSSINSTAGQAAIKRALTEMEANSAGKITFSMISEHRDVQEQIFTLKVETGLLMAGVDENAEFRLVATTDGKMEVHCDDAATKKQIETFFSSNSSLQDDFLYIQALGNMERAGQSGLSSSSGSLSELKAGLQSQAMEAFFSTAFSTNMTYSSLIGNFGSDGTDYFLGANYTV